MDDIERPRMLYAAFARSPFGAARVEKISVEDAIGVSGVERVITRSDLEDVPGLRPVLHRPEFVGVDMPLLSGERVRHAGEPVALVLADSPHAAEDGADAVAVEYERQEAVISLDAALAEDRLTRIKSSAHLLRVLLLRDGDQLHVGRVPAALMRGLADPRQVGRALLGGTWPHAP